MAENVGYIVENISWKIQFNVRERIEYKVFHRKYNIMVESVIYIIDSI